MKVAVASLPVHDTVKIVILENKVDIEQINTNTTKLLECADELKDALNELIAYEDTFDSKKEPNYYKNTYTSNHKVCNSKYKQFTRRKNHKRGIAYERRNM